VTTMDLTTHFATLQNFGYSLRTQAYVLRPTRPEEVADAFRLARRNGLTVAVRGAGRSYNDAAHNGGGIVLDLSGMNRILSWDAASGEVVAEAGATLQQLWQRVEPDGWWPPVVSGTMRTTLGGCLAANIHGKNNFTAGTIGEHVLEFTALLPTGASVTCSPKRNADLFYSMIGGLGLLGVFITVKLKMRRVHSGLLEVAARPSHNLHEHLADLLELAPTFDYVVGWVDGLAGGRSLGRGQIHAARYLKQGEDPDPARTIALQNQVLPDRLFGVVPKAMLHYFMGPFMNNLGVRAVNTGKYLTSLGRHTFRQSHAAFHFLLDYVPDWEMAYGRGGLLEYQSFVPTATAEAAWTAMLSLSQKRGLPTYLGVTKRHRPDRFLLTHAVDGFSFAMDFKITDGNRAALAQLLQDFDRIVLESGGRFYFVKNSDTLPETAARFFGPKTMAQFRRLKRRCDPDGRLESNLYRRLFA
jgi:decaprenylphospho-beta-D-ribofuranose 2-oxidase